MRISVVHESNPQRAERLITISFPRTVCVGRSYWTAIRSTSLWNGLRVFTFTFVECCFLSSQVCMCRLWTTVLRHGKQNRALHSPQPQHTPPTCALVMISHSVSNNQLGILLLFLYVIFCGVHHLRHSRRNSTRCKRNKRHGGGRTNLKLE